MVKSFKEVMDLERAKIGDIVVFPGNERRLNLAASTFSRMGLSVGDLSRSVNDRNTVESWLVRRDSEPRAFLLAYADYGSTPTGDELLLGLGAVSSLATEDPAISFGALVPFGPDRWPMKMKTWAACWDRVNAGAVRKKLLALMGSAGAISDAWSSGPGRPGEDSWLDQAWNGSPRCVGWQGAKEHADWYFPRLGRSGKKVDADTYHLSSLMKWDGPSFHSRERIQFGSGFLKELAKRGAVAFRPDRRFVDAVTASVAQWACEQIAHRFAERVDAGTAYLKGLADDVRRDKGRVKAYLAASRKMAAGAKAALKAVEKLTEAKR